MAKAPRVEPRDQPRAPATPGSGLYSFAETVTVAYAPPGGRSHTLQFRDGVPYALHPHLVAYLAANGINPTQS